VADAKARFDVVADDPGPHGTGESGVSPVFEIDKITGTEGESLVAGTKSRVGNIEQPADERTSGILRGPKMHFARRRFPRFGAPLSARGLLNRHK
jgi:hypothetical protein